jgi:hypothetical protein
MFAEMPLDNRMVNKFAASPLPLGLTLGSLWLSRPTFNIAMIEAT